MVITLQARISGFGSLDGCNVKKFMEPEEWDYWYEGKPAAKELPDPFGTIIIEEGEVRDGGSYWNRPRRD